MRDTQRALERPWQSVRSVIKLKRSAFNRRADRLVSVVTGHRSPVAVDPQPKTDGDPSFEGVVESESKVLSSNKATQRERPLSHAGHLGLGDPHCVTLCLVRSESDGHSCIKSSRRTVIVTVGRTVLVGRASHPTVQRWGYRWLRGFNNVSESTYTYTTVHWIRHVGKGVKVEVG